MKYTTSLLLILALCGCYGKKPKIKTGFEGKQMPSISLLTYDSATIFNTNSITSGKPTLIFSFVTWCPYCKAQTKSLIDHIGDLKDINICMVCNSDFTDFKKFYDHYELAKYPNIKSGVDYNMTFEKYFRSAQIPFLAIYDEQKNLKEVRIGKTNISTIRKIALD